MSRLVVVVECGKFAAKIAPSVLSVGKHGDVYSQMCVCTRVHVYACVCVYLEAKIQVLELTRIGALVIWAVCL